MPKLFDMNENNFENITFGKLTKLEDSKYFIPIHNKQSENIEPIIIQLNRCFTLNELVIEEKLSNILELSIEHKSKDIITEFDDQILAKVKDNSEKWFPGKDLGNSYFDNALMNSIKPIKKDKSFKFCTRTIKDMKVYNGSHEKLESSDVIKDSRVNVIVQLYGIWFTQSRFGLTWRLHQIKVNTPTKKTYNCLFKDDDEPDDLENVFPEQ